jgi:hypothetical protein
MIHLRVDTASGEEMNARWEEIFQSQTSLALPTKLHHPDCRTKWIPRMTAWSLNTG